MSTNETTQPVTDYAARIAERQAIVRGFAEQVAQIIGGGNWQVAESDGYSVEIVFAPSPEHRLRFRISDEENEHLTISSVLGNLRNFAPRHDPLEIGVSVNRGAAAVAKDIARRLLPRLREVVEAARKAKAEHEVKAEGARAAFRSLQAATMDKDLPAGCLSLHQHNPDGLDLEFYDDLHNLAGYVPGSTISLRGKVEGYDNPPMSDLELHNLPLPLARQVCALVCGAAVAQRRMMIAAQPAEEV